MPATRKRSSISPDSYIHHTALVSETAQVGSGTKIWAFAHLREQSVIGSDCVVGMGAYIGQDVRVGSRVKIENGAYLFEGTFVEDGVFIGPRAMVTNDRFPRAVRRDGAPKGKLDWTMLNTRIAYGASLGAGAIVVGGVRIGRFAMVGAGALVNRDVPSFGLVVGVPARLLTYVCACGASQPEGVKPGGSLTKCSICGEAPFPVSARGATR